MSHEIETGADGTASMAYAGDVPWHTLGKSVSPDLAPREMAEAAQVLWTVEKDPAFIFYKEMKDGKEVEIKKPIDRAALRRSSDNKILDTVPLGWNPLQNEEAFEFFADFVAKGDMEMHTAGSLKGGQLVWALAKVKDGFMVGKNDAVESHLLFTNPHQFGRSVDIRFTPIRVVCWNTLSMALGTRGDLTIDQQIVKSSHRKPFDAEKVKGTLGLAHKRLEEYKDAAQFIASKRYTMDDLNLYLGSIFEKKGSPETFSRNHSEALNLIHKQPGADIAEGSWWQAFNVVTYMTDHILGRLPDTRLESAWFGSNRKLKARALNEAVVMAKKSEDLVIG